MQSTAWLFPTSAGQGTRPGDEPFRPFRPLLVVVLTALSLKSRQEASRSLGSPGGFHLTFRNDISGPSRPDMLELRIYASLPLGIDHSILESPSPAQNGWPTTTLRRDPCIR